MIDAYRDAGGRGPAALQVHLSWAPTEDEAEAIAHEQWRSNVFAPPVCWDLETAEHFDVVSGDVPPETGRRRCVNVSADLGRHAGLAARVRGARASTRSTCTTSGRSRTAFIDAFGAKVLPKLRRTG